MNEDDMTPVPALSNTLSVRKVWLQLAANEQDNYPKNASSNAMNFTETNDET